MKNQVDSDLARLTAIARSLHMAPQLQVDEEFEYLLDRRLKRHFLQKQHQRPARTQVWLRLLRQHTTLAGITVCCLLLVLASTAVLAAASQASDSVNPLYHIKQWAQNMGSKLAPAPQDLATVELQSARQHLGSLISLAGAQHEDDFAQALAGFQQQLASATSSIAALPSGNQRAQLEQQLATLQTDARKQLRDLLPNLSLTENLAITSELGKLGDSVPMLISATLTYDPDAWNKLTITIAGSGLQPDTQLLYVNHWLRATRLTRDHQLIFLVKDPDNLHPNALIIRNPDGTTAQTSQITSKNQFGPEPTPTARNGDNDSRYPFPSWSGQNPTPMTTPYH